MTTACDILAALKTARHKDTIVTITSCKRLALFQETMRSVQATWAGLQRVAAWWCIDDNSSAEDRAEMTAEFGSWVEFVWKTPALKGHITSMNMIRDLVLRSGMQWWVHLEDDWLFFEQADYIGDAVKCMIAHPHIHQVLFNKNYGELFKDGWSIAGDVPLDDQFAMHGHGGSTLPPLSAPNSLYWPHFSLRPSVVRVAFLATVPGTFATDNGAFFEMEFAKRWVAAGGKSAFFSKITCLHTGKLTTDPVGTANAYTLNNVSQFTAKSESCGALDSIICECVEKALGGKRAEAVVCIQTNTIPLPEWVYTWAPEPQAVLAVLAVTPSTVQWSRSLRRMLAGNSFDSQRSVVAHFLTHVNVWQTVCERNQVTAIVDDNVVVIDEEDTAVVRVPELAVDRQLRYLGPTIDSLVRDCASAYIISPEGARVLLTALHNQGMHCPVHTFIKQVLSYENADTMYVVADIGESAVVDKTMPGAELRRVQCLSAWTGAQVYFGADSAGVADGIQVVREEPERRLADFTVVFHHTRVPHDPHTSFLLTWDSHRRVANPQDYAGVLTLTVDPAALDEHPSCPPKSAPWSTIAICVLPDISQAAPPSQLNDFLAHAVCHSTIQVHIVHSIECLTEYQYCIAWDPRQVLDSVMTGTVCFYCGGLDDAGCVDPDVVARLPADASEWGAVIATQARADLWAKKISQILAEKERVLAVKAAANTEFFPMLYSLLNGQVWEFFPGMDVSGNDSVFVGKQTLETLMSEAEKVGAVAFNTLGFMKHTASKQELVTSPYIGAEDGVYIRKEVLGN